MKIFELARLTLCVALGVSSVAFIHDVHAQPKEHKDQRKETIPATPPNLNPRGMPPCPGPADFIPAYTLSDLSSAILANPASRIKLCNNIDAFGATIRPLGYHATDQEPVSFSGVLEGNHFEIQNFNVDGNSLTPRISAERSLGLFSKISGSASQPATIRNLTLRNGTVIGDNYNWSTDGVLAGHITDATLSNVQIVNGQTKGTAVRAHGLVAGQLAKVHMSNISINGTVGADLPHYWAVAGGLAGYADDSVLEEVKLSVRVENGIAISHESGSGGLIGEARRVALRRIHGNAVVRSAGGVAGLIGETTSYSTPNTISDVDISVDLGNRLIQSGPNQGLPAALPRLAAGVTAYNYGPLNIDRVRIRGTIKSEQIASGVIALNSYGPTSLGEIAVETSSISSLKAGGLVGYAFNGPLTIANAYAVTALEGTAISGGIIADVSISDPLFGNEQISIINSYFAGTLGGAATEMGGIIGKESNPAAMLTVANTYYDQDLIAAYTNIRGTPVGGYDMRTMQSIYENWDFNQIWRFASGLYPSLRVFGNPADFNGDGSVTVQDLLGFLQAYFAGNLAADINKTGALSPDDIFGFLAAFHGESN